MIEQPGYLGALQAFSLYRPTFLPFGVTEHGVDHEAFETAAADQRSKLVYCVPNFQNPSGLTYSGGDRVRMCQAIEGKPIILIEDDPYGDLRFRGKTVPSFHSLLPHQTVLLGSFSKTVIPGFRIGWIVAPSDIMQKVLIAKQAADLHTCHFTQNILYYYMADNNIDVHISRITEAYGRQCRAMVDGLQADLAEYISFTRPEGGMFLWGRLIAGGDAMDLIQHGVENKVVFVPGAPFNTTAGSSPDFRMSFSCVDEATIAEGIGRLKRAVESYTGGRLSATG